MKSKMANEQELLASVQLALPTAQRVLAFAPHPDDEIFGCGGILALLHNQGCSVSVVVVTDGAAGGGDAAGDLVRIRADESRRAAGVLGLPDPTFWGLPDRGIAYGESLVERMETAITATDADLVLLPSPTELHPDHQALALAGAEALRRLGGDRRAVFYELNLPLPNPNLMIDITTVFEEKRAAMSCFPSQLAEQPYDRRIEGLNRFRAYFLGPHVVAAEAYVLLDAASIQPGLAPLFEGPLVHRRRLGCAVGGEDIPLVSVIIRSMDRPTLNRALDSLALQTWPNVEVVLVNAKGGEHTPVGDHCGRFPLRLVNAGGAPLHRSRAANIGLDACRGTYIGFLDDDGAIDPDHLHNLVMALRSTPKPAAAYAGVRGVDINDKGCRAIRIFKEPEVGFSRLLLGNIPPIHAVLFPALLLSQNVAVDETLDLYEDWDFWLQIAQRVPFVFVDQITASSYLGGISAISPLDPDGSLALKASFRLYEKWQGLVGPEVLQGMGSVFLQAVAERENSIVDLVRAVEERDREVAGLARVVAERDREVAGLVRAVAERDAETVRHKQLVAVKDEEIAFLQQALSAMRRSSSWRITAPLRFLRYLLRGDFDHAAHVVWRVLRRLALLFPADIQNFLGRQLMRIKGWGSALAASLNPRAVAAIIAQRLRLTHDLQVDPLTASPPAILPRIDITVVTYNSSRWIDRFVESLLALDYPKGLLSVFFVDNSSTDSTMAELNGTLARIQAVGISATVLLQPNRGFGAGHNAAIKAGKAPFCLVTNIDLVFEPEALLRVVATAAADEEGVAAWELRQKPYEHPKFYDPVTGLTNWNSHACVLLRRTALESVGGYDEFLFMYGEDVELSYRLRRAGFLLKYCPAATVLHYSYESPDKVKPLQYSNCILANLYLRLKFGTWRDGLAVFPMALWLLVSPEVFPGSRRAVLKKIVRLGCGLPRALLGRRGSKAVFSFRGWDYDLSRDGAFVEVKPLPPDRPLVSVITRTYQGRTLFLKQALLSVAHQTYPHIEHIVVEDGGETQRDCVEEVRCLTGRDIRFLPQAKVGRSAVGNTGLAAARGRWCLFLDDDDLLFAEHVEVLVQALLANQDAVAAYSPAWEVVTDTSEMEKGSYAEVAYGVPAVLRQDFDFSVLQHHNIMAIQSVLFAKTLFEERGGFAEDMDALEDWNLWLRYAFNNRFVHVPKLTSMFRTPADLERIKQRAEAAQAAYFPALARAQAQFRLLADSGKVAHAGEPQGQSGVTGAP